MFSTPFKPRSTLKDEAGNNIYEWSATYPFTAKLINADASGTLRIAEIGVCGGRHLEYLLENTAIEKAYGIDPMCEELWNARPVHDQRYDDHFETVSSVLSRFGDRCELIRKTSVEASADIEDGSLDFIFIDADHSYESVLEDLTHWCPKVRQGGIISGHDWEHCQWPGVGRAVKEFFASDLHKLHGTPEPIHVWWIFNNFLNI